MADTVSIGGKKVNKWAAGAIGAAAIGGGYLLYRSRQNAAAAASSSASTPVDPLTGYPQGSAEDQAALAAQQSAAYGSGFGGGGYGFGGGTYPIYSGGSQVGTTTGVSYPDNASWAQAVEAGLSSVGYTATDVSAAIGRYLARLSVTSAQATIIYAAIAEYGPPPSGTFQVILQPTTGGGGGGSGSGSGSGSGGSAPKSAPSGLSATGHTGYADFGWGAVSGATGYDISIGGAVTHEPGDHAEHVTLSKGAHKWQVRATNSAGNGPWSAQHTVTVH